MKKRILSILLAMCMLMSLLPIAAFATGTNISNITVLSDKENQTPATGITATVDTTEITLTVAQDTSVENDGTTVYLQYKVGDEEQPTVNETAITITAETGTDGEETLSVSPDKLSIGEDTDATEYSIKVERANSQDEQTYTVSGTVTKSADITDNSIDVNGLTVTLYKVTESGRGDSVGTATVANGKYSFSNVEDGSYQAVIAGVEGKYADGIANVTVNKDNINNADIELKAETETPPAQDVEITEVNIVISTNKIQAGENAKFPVPTVTTVTADENEAAATVEATWTDKDGAAASAPTVAGEYTATFTVTEGEGYTLAGTVKYKVNGTEVSSEALKAVITVEQDAPLNITVTAAENGEVKVEPETAYEDDIVTITATPKQGYEVDTVEVTYAGDTEGATEKVTTTKVGDTTYTFPMPAKAATVTVTFKEAEAPQTYKVTIADDITNGTVTADKTEAAADEEITLTVKPAQGYTLDTLTYTVGQEDPVNIADNKFKMPAGDVTINATFKVNERNITFNYEDPANGEVKATVGDSDTAVTKAVVGTEVTLTITPANGYGLDTLKVIGDTDVANQVSGGKYTFTMPDSDVNVRATFVAVVEIGEAKPDVAPPAVVPTEVKNDVAVAVQEVLVSAADDITFDESVLNSAAAAAAENAVVKASDLSAVTSTINGLANKSEALGNIATAVDASDDSGKLENVNVVTQLYMQVKITAADTETATKSVTFEITPMVQNVLTTAADANAVVLLNANNDNATEANAIAVGDPAEAYITAATKVTLPLPTDFSELTSLWVKHVKDGNHFYLGEVKDNVLSFTTNGFSPFTVYATAEGAGLEAQIDNTGYETLAEAIADVESGKTIKLLANVTLTDDIEVNRTVSFTIEKGAFTITGGEIVAADGFKNTGTGDNYVFVEDNGGTTPDDKPTGGGGGGGVSSNVTVSSAANGKVTVSNSNAKKGDTVTITLTPNDGYVVDTVTVTDSKGNAVEVSKTDDTHYTFVMPDGRVTVKATFKQADTVTPPATGFTDVATGAYYADAVKWAVEQGITNGLTATTFGPDNSCTRGQMVTFLWRAAGSPAATGTNSFSDVASGEYYYDAVLWAVEKGITNGTSATTFSPNATVTRGQTVTFLYRYAGSPAVSGDNSFTDVASGEFYASAVTWAVAEGITNGTSTTTFSPASNCTRGQIVTFLYRQIAQ